MGRTRKRKGIRKRQARKRNKRHRQVTEGGPPHTNKPMKDATNGKSEPGGGERYSGNLGAMGSYHDAEITKIKSTNGKAMVRIRYKDDEERTWHRWVSKKQFKHQSERMVWRNLPELEKQIQKERNANGHSTVTVDGNQSVKYHICCEEHVAGIFGKEPLASPGVVQVPAKIRRMA